MTDAKNHSPHEATPTSLDLEKLSQETGISMEMLKTLQGISDPNNAHLFTAESARKAFAHVKIRDIQFEDPP